MDARVAVSMRLREVTLSVNQYFERQSQFHVILHFPLPVGQASPTGNGIRQSESPTPVPSWASPCQTALQHGCTAVTQRDLCQVDGQFHSALNTAGQLADLRRTQPGKHSPSDDAPAPAHVLLPCLQLLSTQQSAQAQ